MPLGSQKWFLGPRTLCHATGLRDEPMLGLALQQANEGDGSFD